MGDGNTEMRAYTKYTYFFERSLGLGRNGKRLVHGAAAAGGVWAAGHYGGVEIINNNMPQAVAIGGVAGVGITILADFALLNDHEEALMALEDLRRAEQSNPEMRRIIASNRDEINKLRGEQQPAPKEDELPNVIRGRR